MNARAIENFISLPYTSGIGYYVFRSPWDILNCVCVCVFFCCCLKYIEEKRPRSLPGEWFHFTLNTVRFCLELKFEEQPFRVHRG